MIYLTNCSFGVKQQSFTRMNHTASHYVCVNTGTTRWILCFEIYTRTLYHWNVNRPFDGMNLKHIPTHWLLSKREYSVKGGNWQIVVCYIGTEICHIMFEIASILPKYNFCKMFFLLPPLSPSCLIRSATLFGNQYFIMEWLVWANDTFIFGILQILGIKLRKHDHRIDFSS